MHIIIIHLRTHVLFTQYAYMYNIKKYTFFKIQNDARQYLFACFVAFNINISTFKLQPIPFTIITTMRSII